jgi:hypothetical protein
MEQIQPTSRSNTQLKFQLAHNLKTAKEINFTLPPSLLARVEEVIE